MIRIEKDALARALHLPCSLANGGGNLAILNSVLVKKSGGVLEVTGTDLGQTITSSVQDVDGAIDPFVVDSRRLSSIVRAADNDDIELEHVGAELRIKAGAFKSMIPTLAENDFPTEAQQYGPETTLTSGLMDGIRRVSAAMPSKDIRYYLNGLHIESMAGNITAVATDGHRISHVTRQIEDGVEYSIIVPKPVIGSIEQAKTDVFLAINLKNSSARFRFYGTSIETKLIEAKYPNWRRSINPRPEEWATVDASLLKTATALILAATPRDDTDIGVHIEITPGSMRLHRSAGAKGTAETTIRIDGGQPGKAKMNAAYLHEAAKSAPFGPVEIAISSAGLFFMTAITDKQEWTHAVNGMR